MSNEIDFDTNNLCIAVSEDAFEEFQANAMQIEEACITLPFDGSPPPNTEAEANAATVIPSDNEVVSSTNPNPMEEKECLPLVYFPSTEYDNQVVINTEIKKPEDIPETVVSEGIYEDVSTSLSSIDRSQNITSDYSNNVPHDLSLYTNTDNCFVSNLDANDDNVIPQKTIYRRGRKKKTINNDNLEMDVNSSITPEIKIPKKRGRKKKVIESAMNNTDISADIVVQEDVPLKRRGRWKKNVEPNDSMTSNVDTGTDIVEENTQEASTSAIQHDVPLKRRGRRKKNMVHNDSVTNNLETSIDEIQHNTQDATILAIQDNAPLKRRGRKKINVVPNDSMTSDLETSTDEIQEKTEEATNFTIQDNVPIKRRGGKKINVIPNTMISDFDTRTDNIQENSRDTSTGTDFAVPDSVPLKTRSKGRINSTPIDNSLMDNFDTNTDNVIKKNTQETNNLNSSSIVDEHLKDVNNESLLEESNDQTLSNNNEPSIIMSEIISGPSSDNMNKSNEGMLSDDEADDISLSKLKSTIEKVIWNEEKCNNEEILNTNETSLNSINVTPSKRNSKMPVMSDFEYNIDSVLSENVDDKQTEDNKESNEYLDILAIDSPKRPTRRRARKTFHYDEESDEDPFANVELSDDNDDKHRRGRKGYKYYSDDEYIPGEKRGKRSSLDSSDDDIEEYDIEELRKQKRKKHKVCSPKKSRSKKLDTEDAERSKLPSNSTTEADCLVNDDIESCLDTSVISTENPEEMQSTQSWGTTHEFENFLAKKIKGTELKIKKITATTSTDSVLTPLKIPVIDPNETKKTIDTCSQTDTIKTLNIAAQTTTPYAIKMKENVVLTPEQSNNACEFLKSVFTTTSELGQLMTQKSDDFVKKKITTAHVKDTFKIDYCVEKSFLLLKLAKNNITQMEDDLSKQYEQFLENNNLMGCREEEKKLEAKLKTESSDSDCEIVETPVQVQPKQKPKFNPKTVFLNKELSIKIAKKSTTETKPKENINIKGRHTVWISDSVMVKKVKPSQSFLAQDSRNKKPPDCFVTYEMVNNFFKSYYHQQALLTCAPFITTEWLSTPRREQVCNYFVKPDKCPSGSSCIENVGLYEDNNTENRNAVNNNSLNVTKNILSINMRSPRSLSSMCLEVLQQQLSKSNEDKSDVCYDQPDKLSASTSPTDKVTCDSNKSYFCKKNFQETVAKKPYIEINNTAEKETLSSILNDVSKTNEFIYNNEIKSLFSLCVKLIQTRELIAYQNSCLEHLHMPHTLQHIAFIKVKHLLYNEHKKYQSKELKNVATIRNKTVYKVKSLSDICFKFISTYYTKDICESTNTEPGTEMTIDNINTLSEEAFLNIIDRTHFDIEDSSQEYLENCDDVGGYVPDYEVFEENQPEENNWVSQVQMEELTSYSLHTGLNRKDNENEETNLDTDDTVVAQVKIEPIEEITSQIKMEPETHYDQMTIIPESVCTKMENIEHSNVTANLDHFEEFVRSSKLMFPLNEDPDIDGIFSQSALRIRRQHEPDSDNENEYDMSLLVPQIFGPSHLNNARNSLMESSSGDENLSSQTVETKKNEKKYRGKPKRTDPKSNKTLLTVNKEREKVVVNTEISIITRRMKEKIRQEEKKIIFSDSEEESVPLSKRKEKDTSKVIDTNQKLLRSKNMLHEIQCNDVDSTEPETIPDKHTKDLNVTDQNENYDKSNDAIFCLISPNEPVELLECEPLLPMFENDSTELSLKENQSNTSTDLQYQEKNTSYVEQHDWNCYPVNSNDIKLYGLTQVVLHKLPAEFYDTYMRYKDISDKNKEDNEVDKLINLQSLNRTSNIRDQKRKPKDKIEGENASKSNSVDEALAADTYDSDHYSELTPSEDEGEKVDDQIPSEMAPKQSENCIAKNSLMYEEDSDPAETNAAEDDTRSCKNEKIESASKKHNIKEEHTEQELMLTADKMMNKELALLHAPVNLKHETEENMDKESPSKDGGHKKTLKNPNKSQSKRDRTKSDNDSSSEEEKQWVNTKEKLLKRMEKKPEDNSIEDAKRTKIVNEFIERRGDATDRKAKNLRGRPRRSYKKFLEHQKQMRVLSHELFGETSTFTGKKSYQSFAKGRRNIRKVIDKKSLARSTVVANMEEFERKRRLNIRQSKLREVLGVEEGVNVVVINDEVCLEYDFAMQQPVVTVHPFFTKVMKAHQYEGVKFMWDACFECLATVESDHPGGGCILAHCMGLGKTLQVLALLHTVLTHPRVGMKRVLVCCPLSTVLNWVDEIHKWIGPVTDKIKVFELSKLKKTYERAYQLEDWYNGGGIFIIGYELFRSLSTLDPYLDNIRPTIVKKIRNALLDPGPDIVVCDEGHLLKNDSSVLAVAMSRVATKRRLILTGTPMQNNLREYYCMVNFVKPNLLGTYSEYSNRFENPIMNGQHRDSREEDIKLMKARTHILHKVLEGCLQRQEASVLYPYLPKKHEYTVFISLTKCQWNLYKHYITNYAKKHTRQSVLKDFHVLQKIWSHPQVLHNFQMKARDNKLTVSKEEKIEDELAAEDLAASEDIKPPTTEVWWLPYLEGGDMLNLLEASNKFVAVFSILDECVELGDKVLIFSTSLFSMDSLEYFLKKIKKWSLGTEYYRLDGTVPPEVRQKWCREFNAENNVNTKLFLVSTRAGCLGLNMVAANRVIILDTSWNPAHDIQSIFRVYRFGQKKDCYIYRLVALGTMEQKIYERAVTKQAIACRVVDEQQIDRHYNMSELTELYRFDEAGANVPGGVAVGVSDVALLRVARHPALHAVHEHDSLLRGSHERDLPEHERAAAWMQFQQEQTHRHLQNQLTSCYLPSVRPHGHDYARPPGYMKLPGYATSPNYQQLSDTAILQETTPPESIEQSQSAEEPPEIKVDPEVKDKQLQPTNNFMPFKKCIIPIQRLPDPLPSNFSDKIQKVTTNNDLDEAKVKKITNLLIKHNFQTRPPKEISELVAKVRRIVSEKQLHILEESSELIRNIACVMLGRDENETDFENVIDKEKKTNKWIENKANDGVAPSTSKAGTVRRVYTRKRKAALAAEQSISSLESSVIDIVDLDDDDWAPSSSKPYEEQVSLNRDILGVSCEETLRAIQSIALEDPDPNLRILNVQGNVESILLSDDDEPPSRRTVEMNKMVTNKEVNETKTDDSEPLFLHPSLLTNENFIKIVAHTYLAGNPMLDEDAATLAAKYSTGKVKAEFDKTGKPIESGPIYDIAVKVLGKDVMKKLHVGGASAKNSLRYSSDNTSIIATKSTAMVENSAVVAEKPTTRYKPGPKSKKLQKTLKTQSKSNDTLLTRKTQKTSNNSEMQKTTDAGFVKLSTIIGSTKQTEMPRVVPVGMFKGPANITESKPSNDECILPDDDFCVIDIDASTPATTNYPQPTQAPTTRRNSQPLMVNNIRARGDKTNGTFEEPRYLPIAPKPTPKPIMKTIEFTGGKLLLANSSEDDVILSDTYSMPATQPQPTVTYVPAPQSTLITPGKAAPTSAMTICLDSDEEETIVPTIHPDVSNPPKASSISDSGNIPVGINMPTLQKEPILPDIPTLKTKLKLAKSSNKTIVMIPKKEFDKITSTSPAEANKIINKIFAMQKSSIAPQSISYGAPVVTQTVNLTSPTNSIPFITSSAIPTSAVFAQPTTTPTNQIVSGPPQSINQAMINTAPILTETPLLRTHNEAQASSTMLEPTTKNNLNRNLTKCKPGDILRITQSGQLEVLNRQDDSVITVIDDSPSTRTQITTKRTTENTVEKNNSLLDKGQKHKAKSLLDLSSSSDESRSASPDPLSILKNVVHIPADAYETSVNKQEPKSKAASNRTVLSFKDNKSVKTATVNSKSNKTNRDPSVYKKSSSSNDVLKMLSKKGNDIILLKTKHKSAEQKLQNKQFELKTTSKTKTPSSNKLSSSKVRVVVDTVDLTDTSSYFNSNVNNPNRGNTSKSTSSKYITSKASDKSKVSSTIVGTSKNIIIGGSGQLIKRPSLLKDSSPKVIDMKDVVIKSETMKRPSESVLPIKTPKKKKTENEMTLKDFDIDDLSDLDDIIELE